VINIAVFASGNGSNAVNIFHYFHDHDLIYFKAIYCNSPQAGIINKAADLSIPCRQFNKAEWINGVITSELELDSIDFIILAGFLWLVPADIINTFHGKILNIHPSLLPLYGGKGMYGLKVHETVIHNKEKESGITIHLVNTEYDKGEILFQKKINVDENETPLTLASKIHQLEHRYYPITIEKYIKEFEEERNSLS